MAHSDGVAVVAIFVKTGKTHVEMKKLCEFLSLVKNKGEAIHVQENLDLSKIIPGRILNFGFVKQIAFCRKQDLFYLPWIVNYSATKRVCYLDHL